MPQSAEKTKARYDERRRKGLCAMCGVIPSPRFARCTYCRETFNRHRGKQRLRKEWRRCFYWKRRQDGLCVGCGEPSTFARCEFCRTRFNQRRNWKKKYDEVYREAA